MPTAKIDGAPRVLVTLSPSEHRALQRLARTHNVSRPEAFRILLRNHADRLRKP